MRHDNPAIALTMALIAVGTLIAPSISGAATPYLVKDTNPNDIGWGAAELVEAGGLVFFRGTDGNGSELWVTDGTGAGTVMVKDIVPGGGSSTPANLTPRGGEVYFTVGHQLWVSDGTAAGTVLVYDFSGVIGLSELTPVGGLLCLHVHPPGTHELWCSDGTTAGTQLVATIYPFNVATAGELTAAGGLLFFSGYDAGGGRELWVSDGTAGGTGRVLDIYPGAIGSEPAQMAELNGRVYFRATDPVAGAELWTSDGTAVGTTLVRDIWPGAGFDSSSPFFLTRAGNGIFFVANDGSSGNELWHTDGTTLGTVLVSDIVPGAVGSGPTTFVALGSSVVFRATTPAEGAELWVSDGTGPGTMLLQDIVPGPATSSANPLGAAAGRVFFGASGADGNELWATDGTPGGTAQVADIEPGPDPSGPLSLVDLAGVALFTAFTRQYGRELWRSDGTAAGTALVQNINPSTAGGAIQMLGRVGDRVLFAAGSLPPTLWSSDGTEPGTVQIAALNAYNSESVELGGVAYFRARDDAFGSELWRSDGTAAGTSLVANIAHTISDSTPSELTVLGNLILFRASERFGDTELYRSDGTAGGTFRVADIFPGGGANPGGSSFPTGLTAFNGHVYFSADDGTSGRELWRSDGTGGGTSRVADIRPGAAGSDPAEITVLGNRLYFFADDGVSGRELWSSDGTGAGTALVVDIRPGALGSQGIQLTPFGSLLFLFANDGATGLEPWRSDGTAAGTALLKNLNFFAFGSHPGADARAAAIGDRVYFNALSGSGVELHTSDGTAVGTKRISDIAAGATDSDPDWLTPIGGTLYFAAASPDIWTADGEIVAPATALSGEFGYGEPSDLLLAGGRLFFTLYTPAYGEELWALDVGLSCGAQPVSGCRQTDRSLLRLKRRGGDGGRDSLVWKWLRGDSTTFGELSDPSTDARYSWCIYSGTPGTLLEVLDVPAGTTWDALGTKGWSYRDTTASEDGVKSLKLKGSDRDRAKALLRGRGANLPDTSLANFAAPLTVQLINSTTGLCLEARYEAGDVDVQTDEQLKARTP